MTNEERQLILEGLYLHYGMHKKKLLEIKALIMNHGGKDPEIDGNSNSYPATKTIKDKIKFILKENENQKLTSREITNCIKIYEPDINPVSVNQFCVMLGKSKEIGVESGYKNKYYYIKNE